MHIGCDKINPFKYFCFDYFTVIDIQSSLVNKWREIIFTSQSFV